ncbi:MAG TPA: glycogen synthase [Steroidobacteraceae bacterium]|nr:glycogen synthase [Steroidobacteraceae bacterium]
MRICAIASEVAPLAKTGGLADVTGALTRFLTDAGHDVRMFMPRYASIDPARLGCEPLARLEDVPLALGPHRYRFSVLRGRLPGSVASIYLVDCPALYERSAIYSADPDEHRRFLLLTRAAFEACQRMAFSPQILHCHDWHAAFAPLFKRTLYGWDRLFAATRSVLTIHNLGYQGVFGAADAADLDLGHGSHLLHQDDLRAGHINSLKHGILYADRVTTVSPTYAREIRTPELGMGLDQVLRQRGDAVLGILNGVDYQEWDPRRDRHLPLHFDAQRLAPKRELKARLCRRLGLEAAERTPLAGVVSRLAQQKGIDLLLAALPAQLEAGRLVCAVLGSGDRPYEQALAQLQGRFPGRFAFHSGYSDELAHWIEAGSDFFLMPSQYEPCGLNQMYSLRYGTVPVVRQTGGLADSVHRYDLASGTGTGVLFREFTPAALERALDQTIDLYAQPAHWLRLLRNGMSEDFSWEHQGAEYVALYESLAAEAQAGG